MSSGLFEVVAGMMSSTMLVACGYQVYVEPTWYHEPVYAPIVSHVGEDEYLTDADLLEDVAWHEETYPVIEVDAPIYYTETITEAQAISDEAAKEWIAQRESGGSYQSVNGKYWGRYQLSSGWFDGFSQDYILNTKEGWEIQEQQADAYVYSRYGSWSKAYSFWQANGWY